MADNVWNNLSLDGKASTAGNWSLGHIPSDTETAVFNATSTANCDFDIPTLVYGISLATGYTGVVTQNASVDILIGAGGYSIAAGTWTGNVNHTVSCAGSFTRTGGTITANVTKLVMTADGTNVGLTSGILHTLTANANVSTSGMQAINYAVAAGKTLTISNGTVANMNVSSGGSITNAGTIAGAGTLSIFMTTGGGTLSFGVVNCPVRIYTFNGAAAGRTLTLGANTVLGSTLLVDSGDATQTCTLALAGHSLQCTTLTIGARGIISSASAATLTADSIVLGASGSFVEANITFDRTHVTGQSITWAASAPANASASTSWNLARAPWHNDLVIFDATSVNNCSWDIDAATVTVGSISIASGYTGTVTQAATADIGIGSLGFSMAGGTLTGNAGKKLYCAGNWYSKSGGLTNYLVNLVMTGSGVTYNAQGTGTYLRSFENSGTVTVVYRLHSPVIKNNAGATITHGGEMILWRIDSVYSPSFTNLGTINGAGTFFPTIIDQDASISFGAVNCPVTLQNFSTSAQKTLSLADSTVLGSSLAISSSHATNTLTLDLGGKSLSCSALTVSTRGVLTNSGAEADCLVSGAFTLSGASSVVSGAVKLACGSYVQSDGTLTQVSDISIGSGGAAISGGVFTGLETKTVTLNGGAWSKTGGTVTAYKSSLKTVGECTFSDTGASGYYKLWNTGALTIGPNTHAALLWYIVDNDGSINVVPGRVLNIYYHSSVSAFSNDGTITGGGALKVLMRSYDATISFGMVSCFISIQTHSSGGNQKCTLGANSTVTGSVTVDSAHAANTCTLDLAGRSLTANGITVGVRGVLLGGEGVVRNYGSFDSSAGTWTPETSQYIACNGGTIKTAAGQSFNDLLTYVKPVTLASDITVSNRLAHVGPIVQGAFSLTMSKPTERYTGLRRPLIFPMIKTHIACPLCRPLLEGIERRF